MVRIKLLATLLVFSLVFFLAACDDAPPNTKQAKPSVVKKKIAPLPPSMVKPVKPTVSQSQAMPVKNKAASKVTNIDKKESVSVKKVKDTNPDGSAQNISKKDSIDTASEKKTLARLGITNNDETKQLLKGFELRQLDAWSDTPVLTPKGKKMSAKDWADQLNIHYMPTTVFFDEQGNEVLRIDSVVKLYRMRSMLSYILNNGYKEFDTFQQWRRYTSIDL